MGSFPHAIVWSCLTAFALAVNAFSAEKPEKVPEGFKPLFNKTDLEGWRSLRGAEWSIQKKSVVSDGSNDDWLLTDKQYGNFILRVEYKLEPRGNSGVAVRVPAQGDPAHAGIEIQLLDDTHRDYRDLKPEQHTGSLYLQAAARTRATKPAGEWNALEIECHDSEIIVTINGNEVNRVNLNAEKEGREGYTPLRERPRRGFIGLESRGERVEFRKAYIKEL